ncbi:hypothetical protein SAMN05660666_02520 [Novosphingobium aromaticivorans]|uniref:hypothetical protein n=1 Tax=Novosphingobium aromaticivorans TaxID=48935 RepID=UPI0002DBB1B8|nr:hypothetical protein [Novosphingobium aromaticivorans]SCY69546.1 hypothetical protein SAMN05660666_02520 [Novosphingobium aromaticivorans]
MRRFEAQLVAALEAMVATDPDGHTPQWVNARALIARAKKRREFHESVMSSRRPA